MKEERIKTGDVAIFPTGPGQTEIHVMNHATHIEVRAVNSNYIPLLQQDRHQSNLIYMQAAKEEEGA